MKIEIEDIQELINKELSSTLDQKFKTLQEKIKESQSLDLSDQIESISQQIERLTKSINEETNVLTERTDCILKAFYVTSKQMDSLLRAVSEMEHEKDIIHSCEESQRKFIKRFYSSIFVSVGLAILFSISLSCNIIWKDDLLRSEVNDIKYRFLHLRNSNNDSLLKLDSVCNDKGEFNALRRKVIEKEKHNERLARKWEEIQCLERKTQEKQIEMDNLKRKF
ncbi:hypothetical protein [Butyricimonas hominis]|jgi:hypothetical protein|uniref:Uncharacterized protein n=1 Tax=Butyricimonas hominis TaxID=2763032 RepID=A0ABR7CXA1_9BACT|nr:hypothetical protein [Butyricimonas hominis]MBC5620293.1 hypothetical protein [Butyricimonas hominis]